MGGVNTGWGGSLMPGSFAKDDTFPGEHAGPSAAAPLLGGSTSGPTATVQFGSVGRLLGLFEHSKATKVRTGLYPYRPHSQTTRGRPTGTVQPRPSAQPHTPLRDGPR